MNGRPRNELSGPFGPGKNGSHANEHCVPDTPSVARIGVDFFRRICARICVVKTGKEKDAQKNIGTKCPRNDSPKRFSGRGNFWARNLLNSDEPLQKSEAQKGENKVPIQCVSMYFDVRGRMAGFPRTAVGLQRPAREARGSHTVGGSSDTYNDATWYLI